MDFVGFGDDELTGEGRSIGGQAHRPAVYRGGGGGREAAVRQPAGQLSHQRRGEELPDRAAVTGQSVRSSPDASGACWPGSGVPELTNSYPCSEGRRDMTARWSEKRGARSPGRTRGSSPATSFCDVCAPGPHCGVTCYVKDGKIVKVEGTDGHPGQPRACCAPRGSANRQHIYRTDRIAHAAAPDGSPGRGEVRAHHLGGGLRGDRRPAGGSHESGTARQSVAFYSGYTKWYRPFLAAAVPTPSARCQLWRAVLLLLHLGHHVLAPGRPAGLRRLGPGAGGGLFHGVVLSTPIISLPDDQPGWMRAEGAGHEVHRSSTPGVTPAAEQAVRPAPAPPAGHRLRPGPGHGGSCHRQRLGGPRLYPENMSTASSPIAGLRPAVRPGQRVESSPACPPTQVRAGRPE